MNLHAPERQAGETQAQYRARQAASRAAAKSTPSGAHVKAKSTPKHRALLDRLFLRKLATGQTAKGLKVRKHKQHRHATRDALGAVTLVGSPITLEGVKPDATMYVVAGSTDGTYCCRRIWRGGQAPHDLNPNRERDPGKREKPKSAVAKRMDRPERMAMIEAGHAKLMRFFGV